MNKTLFNVIIVCAGIIFLYFMGQDLVAEHKVPTIAEFASSTEALTNNSSSTSSFSELLRSISSSTVSVHPQLSVASSSGVTLVEKNDLRTLETTTLYASKGTVKAFIADTEHTRELGLSGQAQLPKGVGMLFVFDTPGKYGFWMKDMSFPLDLIWIDANKKIVGVTKNVLPTSYPFVFMPPKEISYVMEMDAGSVASFGLTTGTSVSFSLK
jgi:uncharacterized membrane protein (UPF0127 family)